MSLIPDNNLPIFFQKYEIKPSNNAKVLFSTISANPAPENEKGEIVRVWNFNITFELLPSDQNVFELLIDMEKVENEGYTITFEGPAVGTLNLGCKAYNANKYVTYTFDPIKKFILLKLVNLPYKNKKIKLANLNLTINDGVVFTITKPNQRIRHIFTKCPNNTFNDPGIIVNVLHNIKSFILEILFRFNTPCSIFVQINMIDDKNNQLSSFTFTKGFIKGIYSFTYDDSTQTWNYKLL